VGARGRVKVERVFLLVVGFVNERRNNKQKIVLELTGGCTALLKMIYLLSKVWTV